MGGMPNIIRIIKSRKMGWVGHVTRMEAKRITYDVFIRKLEGNRAFRRRRCRW
jgi:hypothetical protein